MTTKTFIMDKDGATVDASTVTVPSDRHFRGAWKLNGKVISEDMTEAKKIFQDKIREVRKPLLEAEDVVYMKALEADDASAKTASVAKKKALRDAPAASAISSADTIAKLKAAWDTSVLGDSPYAQGAVMALTQVSGELIDVTGLDALGIGQTWTDVTSSRAKATEYQNTTGKPIMVSVSFTTDFVQRGQLQVSSSSGSGFITIADADGGDYYSSTQDTDHYANITAIIPNNIYYKLSESHSSLVLRIWAELR